MMNIYFVNGEKVPYWKRMLKICSISSGKVSKLIFSFIKNMEYATFIARTGHTDL